MNKKISLIILIILFATEYSKSQAPVNQDSIIKEFYSHNPQNKYDIKTRSIPYGDTLELVKEFVDSMKVSYTIIFYPNNKVAYYNMSCSSNFLQSCSYDFDEEGYLECIISSYGNMSISTHFYRNGRMRIISYWDLWNDIETKHFRYHENGTLKAERITGAPIYPYKIFDNNGHISEEGTFTRDNCWIGEYKSYHPNGQLQFIGHYELYNPEERLRTQTKKNGVWKEFNDEGNLVNEVIYNDKGEIIK